MPSISIIVPVYKVEAYLRRCVDSILAQTYADYELILVDDGSPDSSGAICDEYAAEYANVHVIHRENGGLSAARNSGIDWALANSDSRWLSFVDSDDWLHRDYLKVLHSAAEENDCLLSACCFCVSAGEEIPQEYPQEIQLLDAESYYCAEPTQDNIPTIACAKLYHKDLFKTLRYPEGRIHEDEFTTYKAVFAAEKVAVTEAQLYAYYQNPGSITRSGWYPRRLHGLEAVEEQITFARETNRERFLHKAARQYLYGAYDQLKLVCADEAQKQYRPILRRKLRTALKLGRELGTFPLKWENLWAYEEAYPAKPFWWLLSKVR